MTASGFCVRFPPIISPLSPGNSLVVLLAGFLLPWFFGGGVNLLNLTLLQMW